MRRSRLAATIGTLVFLAACSSGSGQEGSSPTVPPGGTSVTTSPTIAVQTAIPNGNYRTRPRTEKDLVALGLTRNQIDFARNVNELWKKTIVYELRIMGDQFVLTAASDGDPPIVADQGTFIVHGHTLDMIYYTDSQPEYTMRFWFSEGELRLKLLDNPCKKIDPDHCSDFLVKAAYQALPFEAVS